MLITEQVHAEIHANTVKKKVISCSHKIKINVRLDIISRTYDPLVSVNILFKLCLFRNQLSSEMRECMNTMNTALVVLSLTDMLAEAASRMQTARCSEPQFGADILIRDTGSNKWGVDQPFDKHHIIQRLVEY